MQPVQPVPLPNSFPSNSQTTICNTLPTDPPPRPQITPRAEVSHLYQNITRPGGLDNEFDKLFAALEQSTEIDGIQTHSPYVGAS